MKIRKPCKICKQLKWFKVARNKEEAKKDEYSICQWCRNMINRFKQHQAKFYTKKRKGLISGKNTI